MTAGRAHEGLIAAALADLTPGQERALRHVLACEACRTRVASALKLEADLDDTTEESPVFQGLMKRVPSLFSASARKEGMKLVQILRAADPQARRNLYDSSPLKAGEWANLVLLAVRSSSPPEALEVCDLFDEIVGFYSPGLQGEQTLLQVRGAAARGNIQRLLGQWTEAQARFQHALDVLALYPWQSLAGAELFRAYGVLAWERGELDLAEALLRHSARIQNEIGDPDDEAEAWVLLGLIAAERGASDRAFRLLSLGRRDLSRRRPWLSLQARYEEARAAAHLRISNPWARLEETTTDEEAAIAAEPQAQWLEGRVHAALRDRADAERVLEGARVALLAGKAFAHSALCSVDLALLLLDQGRVDEVKDGLLPDFVARFASNPATPRLQAWARRQLDAFQSGPLTEDQKLEAGATLRRLLRLAGYSVLVEIP